MRLMRNVTPDGQCKYAAVRMDKLASMARSEQSVARQALDTLGALGLLENPKPGEREEFFLVKLKDRNAPEALLAYAAKAEPRDPELAEDVRELAKRAGANNPWAQEPDTSYGVQARRAGSRFIPAQGGPSSHFGEGIAPRVPSGSPIDPEDLIVECVPGGDCCAPQGVADAIRAYFAARTAAVAPVPAAQPLATMREALALLEESARLHEGGHIEAHKLAKQARGLLRAALDVPQSGAARPRCRTCNDYRTVLRRDKWNETQPCPACCPGDAEYASWGPAGVRADAIDGDQPLPDLIQRLHREGLGEVEIAATLARLGRDSEAGAAGISIRAAIAQADAGAAPACRTHTTQPSESLCGIAIRQLGDESRWTEIRDLNADRFPGMLGSDYYPVGTVLKLPPQEGAAPANGGQR